MPPVRLPAGYQLGLFWVAVAMVLLPLVYLGFIALVGWLDWIWATQGLDWFFPRIGGIRRVFWPLVILYVVPLLVGFIRLLLMLKCFFSRWRTLEHAVPISHLDHPEVFRFLGQLCQRMGAPIPSRVDVGLGINASAGLRAGFASLFGNDIMLSFGLPLVAGMNCREFAAVLAHELGHFTQRSAMRFGFIIQTVHGWIYRAVYERDAFDDWLEEASNENAFNLVIFGCARAAIGLTRGLMWLLFVLSHALTSFMSRQMEFHADACATAVAGSDSFIAMLNKLCILHACSAQARIQLRNKVAPKLPDDLSTYVANLAAQCSGQTQGKVLTAAAKERTRWFQSHPSDAERIQRARQAQLPGIIHESSPAATLFNDFQQLSRTLTLRSYQFRCRGRPIAPDRIFHVEAPVEDTVPDTAAEEAAIKSYFGGLGLFLRPIIPEAGARLSAGPAPAKRAQINAARAMLGQNSFLSFREQLKELDARMLQALEANALLRAGMACDAKAFPLVEDSTAELSSFLDSIHKERQRLGRELEPFEKAACQRLLSALSLVRTPAMAARLPNTESMQEEILELLHVFELLGTVFPPLLELRQEFAVLQTLLDARSQNRSELVDAALSESTRRANELLAGIQAALGSAAYPFNRAHGPISLLDYARAKRYDADPARMAQLEVQSHLQMLFAFYYQVLGRLTTIAQLVETELH
jgi:Zn-dependent protease with chaperone function